RPDNRAPPASERPPGRKREEGTEWPVEKTATDAAPGGVPSESGKAPARSAVKDAVDRAGRAADAAARLTPEKTAGAGDSLWEEVRPKTKTKPVLVLE
ncbi:MAG: hypothetical protein LBS30_07000, partial [Planctomycetota bacterium]|nr:hypothetical protein [Planctomycetota bacterium]